MYPEASDVTIWKLLTKPRIKFHWGGEVGGGDKLYCTSVMYSGL